MPDWIPLSKEKDEKLPLPFIKVILVGETGLTVPARALVDTGSSASVLPTELLESIAVDFEDATTANTFVGGGKATYKLGKPNVIECKFEGHTALVMTYASDGTDIVMLGVNDFLRSFDLTVSKANNLFRLTPV
jgi:predicted aspartyl protease